MMHGWGFLWSEGERFHMGLKCFIGLVKLYFLYFLMNECGSKGWVGDLLGVAMNRFTWYLAPKLSIGSTRRLLIFHFVVVKIDASSVLLPPYPSSKSFFRKEFTPLSYPVSPHSVLFFSFFLKLSTRDGSSDFVRRRRRSHIQKPCHTKSISCTPMPQTITITWALLPHSTHNGTRPILYTITQ